MKKFEIGLTLTGTVSAGAYTAGVVDFIIDALEEWEKAKSENRQLHGENYSQWTVPWHDVVIKGLSGASGGGVTNGLILNTIGKTFIPVRTPDDTNQLNNDFYNAWVNLLGIEQLLDVEDMTGNSIKSLLNGKAIPDIADKIMTPLNFGNTLKRPYIDDHLIAILTLTNLRGIPYLLDYNGIQKYNVIYKRHEDYAQFELASDNQLQHADTYLIPYDESQSLFNENYARLKAACLCTCAFPAAFLAQPFSQPTELYNHRPSGGALDPIVNPVYSFLNSDGGILNTEPFMLLHNVMLKDAILSGELPGDATQNPRAPENVVRSIIMVSPLEVGEVFDQLDDYIKDDSLIQVLPDVLGAIRQEALFSAEEIDLAFDEDVYSRFMIAPARSSSPTSNDFLKPAITATILEDFGAFLSRDFREHDYFMGRRNAQQFFRRHFALPVDAAEKNPIFGSLDMRNQYSQYVFKDDNGIDCFPIIPLCGALQQPAFFPAWPTGKGYSMDNLEQKFAARMDKLTDAIASSLNINWFEKIFASLAIKKIKGAVTDSIVKAISKALHDASL